MATTQSQQSQLETCIDNCFNCLCDCDYCANFCLNSDSFNRISTLSSRIRLNNTNVL